MAPLKMLLLATLELAALTRAAHLKFELDLTWKKGAPNGVERDMIFVNDAFPGPALIMDEGDEVSIAVTNHLPFNSSVHFHGIEQKGTPWADGVSGLSQWAILPGQTYTYKWTATQPGTYWYHSHDKDRIMDGLYGAIQIRPSSDRDSPFSMISNDEADIEAMKEAEKNANLVMLSDWDHLTSDAYMHALMETGYDIFCSDSILINGGGSVYCKDPEELTALQPPQIRAVVTEPLTDKGCDPFMDVLQGTWPHHPEKLPGGLNSGCIPSQGANATFQVNPDTKWASFNFISAASLKALTVSIDEHPMYVYEVDGHYIEPQLAHQVPIYSGERYSVMVKLDREPGVYTMRVAGNGNQVISGFATLNYEGGENNQRESVPYIDYGGVNTTASVIPLNTTHLPPYPAVLPAMEADDFHLLQLGRINSSWEWTLDGTAFLPANLAAMEPALFDRKAPGLESALKIETKNNTWVDIVFQLVIPEPTKLQPPHPIHKHSNKAFLMGAGQGKFAWNSLQEAAAESPESFLETPIYRDTFLTSPAGEAWIAIRYHVVNPGAFLLHCHMETHLSSGMGLVLLDGVDAWPEGAEHVGESFFHS
ncbi:CAZyme family AA1 [Penicillium argentinense]|uniref:CAZyme family AA1 n=1 Tax=Penicillium argentinense TaxID=1131581 RepID=A0A9W9EYA5_9EURO|nr:CAZyme family AA1 [Penicillium argentinense]KAJ5090129.1 CAZyme family AA1 [Penicillium argentinense]